jgi:two-component system, sensor histidine kinase PdtaS
MDARVRELPHLEASDLALLEAIEAGMMITADVARADLLLCVLLENGRILVTSHGLPESISSLYKQEAAGRSFAGDELPLVLRALQSGSGGRRQREVLRNGAPIIEDVYPVCNGAGKTIAALVVETTMIAHERQRRRDRHFQQAVQYLIESCARGELASAARLTRFGLYDGIYLVDRSHTVIYMSGIAANMYRTIGLPASLHEQPLAALEKTDIAMVEQVIESEECLELRIEADDGRTWIRRAIPLRVPVTLWQNRWFTQPVGHLLGLSTERRVGQVLVLLHNATEAVAKQRELNVKSALIQEVHHRVKNNLQNIAAILRIQARRSSDETRQHLTDAVNRVLSMSVIHEYLSQGDSRSINVKDVCQRIATQVTEVSRTPDQEIEVRVTGQSIRLPASQATPAALVINELMLNALEHGLKDRQRGLILVALTDLGDAVQIEVSDDGSGLPPDFQPALSSSLGLQIVHTLVTDDLKGTLAFAPGEPAGDGSAVQNGERAPAPPGGTRAIVVFPKRPVFAD